MPSTLARYLLVRTLRGLLVAFAVVAALLALVDFVEATRDVAADSELSSLALFRLTLLKTPALLQETLPFVVLFASMGTLHALNRRSELISAKAAGVSAARYLRPAMAVSLLLGCVWVAAVDPWADEVFDQAVETRNAEDLADGEQRSVWLRDALDTGRSVIRADSFDPNTRELSGVVFLAFERDSAGDQFMRRIDAARARFLPLGPDRGAWQLEDLREWSDGSYGPPTDALALSSGLSERDVLEQATDVRSARRALPSVWQLPGLIAAQGRVGFSTTLAEMKLWKLLSLPVLLVAMTVLGATVSMRLSREGGTWRLVLAGAALGFAVFFLSVFVEAFGEVGTLPPFVATWTVPLVALSLGFAALARLEDG